MSAGECRRALLALLAVATSLLALPVAVAGADQAEELFDPSRMYVIDLGLPPASITASRTTTPMPTSQGTFSIAESDDGTPDGVGPFSVPVNVEIRLKGNFSFRPLGGKAAFKVKLPQDAAALPRPRV